MRVELFEGRQTPPVAALNELPRVFEVCFRPQNSGRIPGVLQRSAFELFEDVVLNEEAVEFVEAGVGGQVEPGVGLVAEGEEQIHEDDCLAGRHGGVFQVGKQVRDPEVFNFFEAGLEIWKLCNDDFVQGFNRD